MSNSIELPAHLGGHLNKTHTDVGALNFFKNEMGCESLIDIGCGPGGQCEAAASLGYDPVLGLDGDFTLERDRNSRVDYKLMDFTKESFNLDALKFIPDLAWSCEFVEHVEEQYIDNFMPAFASARWVAMTYCPPQPDKPNPHHFNEQPEKYWIDLFENWGLIYEPSITLMARAASTMKKPFFQTRGLVFYNDNI